jgi:undecaprenyl-diphosphatase
MLATLFRADAAVFVALNALGRPWLDPFLLLITTLGNGWVAGSFLVWSCVRQAPQGARQRLAAAAILSLTLACLSSTMLKRVIDRPRPLAYLVDSASTAAGPWRSCQAVTTAAAHVRVLDEPSPEYSLPSGHSTAAFAAAATLIALWGSRFAWTFALAALVACSRIYLGVHFPLDTLAGAALGCCVAAPLARLLSRERPA